MRRVVLVAALGALAVSVIAVAALGGGGRAGQDSPGGALFRGVNFVTVCDFSHMSNDDPILFPGQSGASHHHTFFGNTTTGAFSTLESLLAGDTTCHREADTGAYWIPSLMADGETVEPLGATIYYRRHTIGQVEPFPPGFQMIAGNAKATTPQRRTVTFWSCGRRGGVRASSDVPACSGEPGSVLRLHVRFPNCWDGERLTSSDQSHVAYSSDGVCPSSHPVALPAIALIARFPVSGAGNVELASGGRYSAHADFFNAWAQRALTRLVDGCLNALRHCGRGPAR
jgi:hypothetical protein